jgi:hypothetical protein
MADDPRGAGGATPAGMSRRAISGIGVDRTPVSSGPASATNDKCNRLFENLRNAMAAEQRANQDVINALDRLNDLFGGFM